MAHRRTTSASHVQVGCDADVDTRRYASSTSGVTYTRGSVLPDGVSIADSDEFEEESFCDLSDYELEGPSPHGTYYTTANYRYGSSQPRPIASNKGGCHTHADGSARRGFQPGNDLSRISTYQHQRNSYSGNFSQPDHYDEAGNYTGPPAVDANPGDLVSFPRLPDSDPPSLEDEHENTGSQRHISISETSKRSFSEQLVSGVRSLWTSESNKDQVAPQPPRTGTYLFCRHYLIEECACITALEDDGVGDYCQKCWEGRCDGPRPPHSVVRRSLW
ncbi:unnamed protein product [Fusarium langsethiae]|nr:unnamed protein product [Fusarium langsethiae]